jgi:competence protein ComEA
LKLFCGGARFAGTRIALRGGTRSTGNNNRALMRAKEEDMKKRIGSRAIAALAVAFVFVIAAQLANAAQNFGGTVDVNTASVEQLMEIPGIGPSKANAIVAYRAKNPFATIDEVKEVKGIGDKLFAKISPYLTVSGRKPGSGAKAHR